MSHRHRSSTAVGVLIAAALAATVSCDQPTQLPPTADGPAVGLGPHAAPLHSVSGDALPDRYVVVLKEDVGRPADAARDLVGPTGGRVHHVYENALKGFAATLPPQALNGLLNAPAVAYVAQDGLVSLSTDAGYAMEAGTQPGATWGLDRIDQRDLPLDGSYGYTVSGEGVTVYIIDSGILPDHEEFGGRASIGVDFIDDGRNGVDCTGHGTHVAGTVGGNVYGVAKGASLVAVRVFGCENSTPYSVILAAVDWVTANATLPAVVNMSLGGGAYEPLDEAIRASILSGLVYAVSAGNGWGADACEQSPARVSEALTVGASASLDARSEFSNVGACVDLFAPGSEITSAWHTDVTATNTISGTSMSTPHVAGAAALYLEGDPVASPTTVANVIVGTATAGRLADVGPGSPDLLLYSLLTPTASGPVIGVQPSALQFSTYGSGTGEPLGTETAGGMEFEIHSAGQAAGKELTMTAATSVDAATLGSLTSTAALRLSNLGDEPLNWTASADQLWLTVEPLAGTLAAYDGTGLTVTADPTGLPPGEYYGVITVEDPAASNSPRTVEVTLKVTAIVDLESGVPVENLSGPAGSQQHYRIRVPEGAGTLAIQTFGGTGDVDLFARYGDLPDLQNGLADCWSTMGSNDEYCVITSPPAGDWYILLYGYWDFEGVTLLATVGEAVGMIDLWPPYLHFQQLIEPETGSLLAGPQPSGTLDREALLAGRTLDGGKRYPAVRPDGSVTPSVATSQWVWLTNIGSVPLNWTAETDAPWLGVSPSGGSLEPWWTEELTATVDATGLSIGEHYGQIVVTDPAAVNSPQTVEVQLSVQPLNLLDFGAPAEGLSGDWWSSHYFRVTIPDGVPELEIVTAGGTGDVDLFVRYGAPPDLLWWALDCASANPGNDERCVVQAPAAGDWYILLVGYEAFEGVSLLAREGEPRAALELFPQWLFFQQLTDPLTGGLVAAEPPSKPADRSGLDAMRVSPDGKTYPGSPRAGAAPASFYASQPVWVGNSGTATLSWHASSDESWLTVNPAEGLVEPWEITELTASVDASGLPAGYHYGMLTVDDPEAANSPATVWVDLAVRTLRLLDLGVPRENLAGDWDTGPQYFRVTVPEGLKELEIRTSGGTGDLDMFVRHGSPPDLWWWEFDCVSWNWENEELCGFPDPAGGDWYIMVYPVDPFQGATLIATAVWTLEALVTEVDRLEEGGEITAGIAASLRAKLTTAIGERDAGDLTAARSLVTAFILEVRGLQRGGRLDADTAGALVAAAETLLPALGG